MKKLMVLLTVTLLTVILCSCGNRAASDAGSAEIDTQNETQELTEDRASLTDTDSVTETVTEIIETLIDKATDILENPTEKKSEGTEKAESETTQAATSATTAAPLTTTTAAPAPETEISTTRKARKTYGKINFSATDINGNSVSLSDYSGYDVIMINMWEPWCGPCVNEMSDIQKLYTDYKSKGFLVIGAFSDDPDSAKEIINQKGVTYPVINKPYELKKFETGYVPTTIFIDGSGNVLSEEPYIGSRSYSEWETISLSYLG